MNRRSGKSVVVGMSGGVDSSVAAALLKDEGYEVVGVSLNLLTCNRAIERSCCSARDREDARRVCEQLGIEHRVVDCRSRFKELVIDPFVKEYLKGSTPSPCILCNEMVKFPALFDEAKRLGARFVATGHYARAVKDGGKFKLLRGVDEAKDQSYFLFGMKRDELAWTILPLGSMTKVFVRKYARDKGLETREKAESQEICFVPDNDYAAFVEGCAGPNLKGPGNFVDLDGGVVGRHKGIHAYTVGQRRGLGFGIGKRQYVVRIDAEKNVVVLGNDSDLFRSEVVVRGVTWIDAPVCGGGFNVKIRSTHTGTNAAIEMIDEGSVRVWFEEPVRAAAPGQAAVFYRGEEVVGGGWLLES